MSRVLLFSFLFTLIVIDLSAQKIETHFEFFCSDYSYKKLEFGELRLVIDSLTFNKKRKPSQVFLYSYKNNYRVDSIHLPNGYSQLGSIEMITVTASDIFFYSTAVRQILALDRESGKIRTIRQFDLKRDSVIVSEVSGNEFVLWEWANHSIHLFDPALNSKRKVFDFRISADDKYKKYLGSDAPVGIGEIFAFSDQKILVKTGYNEAGASFDCIYFLVDRRTGIVERLPASYFDDLITEPRKILKTLSVVNLDTFSIDIDKMYFDVSESVGYLTCRFLYEERTSETNSKSKSYKQDAFVVDKEFNLIGRALERQIWVQYSIYENGLKTWNMVSSETDSAKVCFFKVKLNYALEQAFYEIYHNKELSQQSLILFDKFEMALLKNFIFAKHNFKFESIFYQGYFNTFIFYGDEAKRRTRTKAVDKLLTAVDRKNLAIIQQGRK